MREVVFNARKWRGNRVHTQGGGLLDRIGTDMMCFLA
jgi:hypothetical protein